MPMWDWLGEPLGIDFANTRKRRGAEDVDLLRDGAELARWSELEAGRVPRLDAATAAAHLDTVRAVRDDVFAVLRAAAAGDPPPAAAAGRLDARVRRHPVIAQLSGPSRVGGAAGPVDELLARAVDAAIGLATSAAEGGLAFCDAPSCGQFFIRERGGQRWCGPHCGTRARVARHAARKGSHPST
jgi:predicted RNA-binding Zn ribbon-like protein